MNGWKLLLLAWCLGAVIFALWLKRHDEYARIRTAMGYLSRQTQGVIFINCTAHESSHHGFNYELCTDVRYESNRRAKESENAE